MPLTTIHVRPTGVPDETTPGVETRDLARLFRRSPALAGVTIQVVSGRAVAILGANGAGKTTLLRVLATALRPSYGSAAVDGIDVGDRQFTDDREGIGGKRGLPLPPVLGTLPSCTVRTDVLAGRVAEGDGLDGGKLGLGAVGSAGLDGIDLVKVESPAPLVGLVAGFGQRQKLDRTEAHRPCLAIQHVTEHPRPGTAPRRPRCNGQVQASAAAPFAGASCLELHFNFTLCSERSHGANSSWANPQTDPQTKQVCGRTTTKGQGGIFVIS
jgi:energy-coupling factor transporter ATP-binding protein EcfA2